ncbi:MAG: hypothetical protein S4CHLAM45_04180 [Chlamydiales bacterium]|nr:hypothetical protein [Chlamydiales bacterium]MCH9619272.1 hypothetical protein [Chlamydiales bacterium]MCH9622534.1 hypothetical protein [Chlamydiales bacterium]
MATATSGVDFSLFRQTMAKLSEEIRGKHSTGFITAVGIDRIMMAPIVTAEALGLNTKDRYHEKIVIPDMLGDESVVRGVDGNERPFIAVKVEILDPKKQKVSEMVEVIYKRYGLNSDGENNGIHENNYVTALQNKCDDGSTCESVFQLHRGSLTGKQMEKLGQLLKGEKIQCENVEGYSVKMVHMPIA